MVSPGSCARSNAEACTCNFCSATSQASHPQMLLPSIACGGCRMHSTLEAAIDDGGRHRQPDKALSTHACPVCSLASKPPPKALWPADVKLTHYFWNKAWTTPTATRPRRRGQRRRRSSTTRRDGPALIGPAPGLCKQATPTSSRVSMVDCASVEAQVNVVRLAFLAFLNAKPVKTH